MHVSIGHRYPAPPVASAPTPQIPIAGPWITDREVEAVAHAARHSWFEHANDECRAFEHEFAAATGRHHAIALPSCTSGLHLGLLALGVGPGDEVIVPETTWIATAAPITYVGATPVFVDVEPDTWCMSRRVGASTSSPSARGRSSPSTSTAASPTSSRSRTLRDDHDLALIEDAAEAAGGRHAGRPAGSFGALSTFSFHGSKTLTTGEGGMVLSRRRRPARADAVPARPRPAARRRLVPQRRGRLEVQDERAAGRARPGAARSHRRADRTQAADLRVVPRTARRLPASRSTSSGPTIGRRTGW